MNTKKIASAALLMVALGAWATPAFAAGDPVPVQPQAVPTPTPAVRESDGERVIRRGNETVVGTSFTLASNETLRGDLNVLGGNAQVEEGSTVEGDVNVFGGNIDIAGNISKDINVIGGNVTLRPSARVDGEVKTVGGNITQMPGAVVRKAGSSVRVPELPALPIPPVPPAAPTAPIPDFRGFWNPLTSFASAIGNAVLLALLSVAAWAVFPRNLGLALDVASSQKVASGGIGLLSFAAWVTGIILLAVLSAVMFVTIVGIPIGMLIVLLITVVSLGLALVAVVGWSVAARMFGAWLQRGLGRPDWSVLTQVAIGAVVLAFLGSLPIAGGLVGLVAACIGVGALALTRLGTRPYVFTPALAATSPAPAHSPRPAEAQPALAAVVAIEAPPEAPPAPEVTPQQPLPPMATAEVEAPAGLPAGPVEAPATDPAVAGDEQAPPA